MGLDITFYQRKDVVCPHCNAVVTQKTIDSVSSGGRVWYDILEELGYYVPYEKRTKENDWYAKDMVLTVEQAKRVYDYIKGQPNVMFSESICDLIAVTLLEKDKLVINADW